MHRYGARSRTHEAKRAPPERRHAERRLAVAAGAAVAANAAARIMERAGLVPAAPADADEVRVDSEELAALAALEGAYESLTTPLDEEAVEAAERAEAQSEQVAIAATLDALSGEVHTCGRCRCVCAEEHMLQATRGAFRNNWICNEAHEAACAEREAGRELAPRKRSRAARTGR